MEPGGFAQPEEVKKNKTQTPPLKHGHLLSRLTRCVLAARSNFKLLAVQGRLYAVGGQCLGTVECYSPEQDWWTCVSSMPDPLAEFSACECQGMIYVMGGYTARG